MEKRYNMMEASVGAIVIIICIAFVTMFYKTSGVSNNGYPVIAIFDRIDGLNVGSDVKVNGVNVGKIIDFSLDLKTYQAKVTISINNDVKLPKDTSAEISSSGLLGEKYIALIPGNEKEFIRQGNIITDTQPSISFEKLIGKFLFSSSETKQ